MLPMLQVAGLPDLMEFRFDPSAARQNASGSSGGSSSRGDDSGGSSSRGDDSGGSSRMCLKLRSGHLSAYGLRTLLRALVPPGAGVERFGSLALQGVATFHPAAFEGCTPLLPHLTALEMYRVGTGGDDDVQAAEAAAAITTLVRQAPRLQELLLFSNPLPEYVVQHCGLRVLTMRRGNLDTLPEGPYLQSELSWIS